MERWVSPKDAAKDVCKEYNVVGVNTESLTLYSAVSPELRSFFKKYAGYRCGVLTSDPRWGEWDDISVEKERGYLVYPSRGLCKPNTWRKESIMKVRVAPDDLFSCVGVFTPMYYSMRCKRMYMVEEMLN